MSFDTQESSTYGSAPFELYKFTRGATSWYIAKGDVPRVHQTQTYVPEQIESSEIELNRETSAGSIEVTITLDSIIASEFVSSLPSEPIWLTKYEGHDGDDEVIVRFKGRAMQAKHGASKVVVTFAPMTTAIGKKIPPLVYQQSCNRIHYSPACGATLDTNSMVTPAKPGAMKNAWSVKIGAMSGFQITFDPFAAENADFVDGWTLADGGDANVPSATFPATEDTYPRLAWGYLESADGRRVMIAKHVGWNIIEVKAPIPGMAVGDIVTVVRGCRRNFKQCQFYKRQASFMGFDVMPQTNPFSGVV